jgi:hypothetical protein
MALVTRKLVLAKLNSAFPDPGAAAEALAALDRFEGPVRDGVQLAIIKLSDGQLWKLRELVQQARKDFRDVLYPAQAPEQFRNLSPRFDPTQFRGRPPGKKPSGKEAAALAKKESAMQKRDQKQWLDWLAGGP